MQTQGVSYATSICLQHIAHLLFIFAAFPAARCIVSTEVQQQCLLYSPSAAVAPQPTINVVPWRQQQQKQLPAAAWLGYSFDKSLNAQSSNLRNIQQYRNPKPDSGGPSYFFYNRFGSTADLCRQLNCTSRGLVCISVLSTSANEDQQEQQQQQRHLATAQNSKARAACIRSGQSGSDTNPCQLNPNLCDSNERCVSVQPDCRNIDPRRLRCVPMVSCELLPVPAAVIPVQFPPASNRPNSPWQKPQRSTSSTYNADAKLNDFADTATTTQTSVICSTISTPETTQLPVTNTVQSQPMVQVTFVLPASSSAQVNSTCASQNCNTFMGEDCVKIIFTDSDEVENASVSGVPQARCVRSRFASRPCSVPDICRWPTSPTSNDNASFESVVCREAIEAPCSDSNAALECVAVAVCYIQNYIPPETHEFVPKRKLSNHESSLPKFVIGFRPSNYRNMQRFHSWNSTHANSRLPSQTEQDLQASTTTENSNFVESTTSYASTGIALGPELLSTDLTVQLVDSSQNLTSVR